MGTSISKPVLAILGLSSLSTALGRYTLQTSYEGQSFLDGFKHQGLTFDPTHGFVKYVDRPEALAAGMVKLNADNSVYLGVDHENVAPGGRRSLRLQSRESFTQGLLVADIAHMPGSVCGTWPAFWLEPKEGRWPQTGEIDIIEGANLEQSRYSTVHIGPQHCKMDDFPAAISHIGRADCYTTDGDATGCPVIAHNASAFGDGYNAVGGGLEVMLWTPTEITMWFFPRAAGIPATLRSASPDLGWLMRRPPLARWTFEESGCLLPSLTRELHVVFNIEICGSWAAGGWTAGCDKKTGFSTCEAFVEKNPKAFVESFWRVNSVKWFKEVVDGGDRIGSVNGSASIAPGNSSAVGGSLTARVRKMFQA